MLYQHKKDNYGQVTHLTQKNFNFDSANSLHDTSIYTLRDVEYTWDSNGYGQQLSYKVQSGDSNGLNAYYDEYVISTYNGISLTTPDTVTQLQLMAKQLILQNILIMSKVT